MIVLVITLFNTCKEIKITNSLAGIQKYLFRKYKKDDCILLPFMQTFQFATTTHAEFSLKYAWNQTLHVICLISQWKIAFIWKTAATLYKYKETICCIFDKLIWLLLCCRRSFGGLICPCAFSFSEYKVQHVYLFELKMISGVNNIFPLVYDLNVMV